jgi:lipoate-protein ligase A
MKQNVTEKWRFVEIDWLSYAQTAFYRPALIKAVSEGFSPETVSFCSFPRPSVILSFFNDPDKDIDFNHCRQRGIPVCRVISSGGPIFGDRGYVFVFMHVLRGNPKIPKTVEEIFTKTLSSVAQGLSDRFGIEVRYRPLNDLEARCADGIWRKIGPSSCFFESKAVQMGSGVQVHQPDVELMASIITPPPEKFGDKESKNLRERLTCLDDVVGWRVPIEAVKEVYVSQIENSFGVELVSGNLSDRELSYYKSFEIEYGSDDFLMERSEKRFQPIPKGAERTELQYKISGGPLVRMVCLTKARSIWRILITGSIHASPLRPRSPIDEIEDGLIGLPIDQEIIHRKIVEILSRPNCEIAKVDPGELAEKIVLCCQRDGLRRPP